MKRRVRLVWAFGAILLMAFALEAACPPVPFGYTTSYYERPIICHGTECTSSGPNLVGECTQECDGSYSCWGTNSCGGAIYSCSTTYWSCGPCEPE